MSMDEDQAYDPATMDYVEGQEEDASAVISAYSEEKGIVRQQLESFEEFIQNTMQEIVDESSDIDIQLQQSRRHRPDVLETVCRISFGQIYLSKPVMTELDGETATLFPKAARLKNIAYSAPLYVDVSKRLIQKLHGHENVTGSLDLKKVFIGKVPIMLRSSYCTLYQKSKTELTELGECPFDQGGYFIINGKVLTAEEKMSTNYVHVFKTRQPNKYSHVAEVWSTAESRNRPPSTMFVRMLSRAGAEEGSTRQYIMATLPYIKTEIPIITVFRALGFVADADILEQIGCDVTDTQMMELLLPSFEEASVTKNQQVALDYIGTHGVTVGATRRRRIKYARDILKRKMLTDVGVGEFCKAKKAYYFGYIIHRLLLCALGPLPEDDRVRYGNKRLDLAGRLLGGRFRMLFRKLTRDVRSYAQESIDGGKDFNLQFAIKAETITSGLEYSLATGNWWQAYGARTRAGVSQWNGTIPANSAVNGTILLGNMEAVTPLNIKEIAPVQTEPGTEAPSHTTAIVGMVTKENGVVTIGADSKCLSFVYVGWNMKLSSPMRRRKILKETVGHRKIYTFGDRFLIGCAGSSFYIHFLLTRGLYTLELPESLDDCISLIWKEVLHIKQKYLRKFKPKETSLIAAIIGAVGLTSDGRREARMWQIDDDWTAPLEFSWTTCGSGNVAAAKEFEGAGDLVRDLYDGVELCLRGLYRAARKVSDVGGNMVVRRLSAPTIDTDSPGKEVIFAPQKEVKAFYSQDGLVSFNTKGDTLLPRQSVERKRKFIDDLMAQRGGVRCRN